MPSLRVSVMWAMSAASAVRFFSGGGRSAVVSSSSSSGVVCGFTTISRASRTILFGCRQRFQCLPSRGNEIWIPSRSLGTRAKIRRRKETSFDNVVEREKKVRIVNKIRGVLVKQPGMTMTLLELGKHRRDFGLAGKRRVISLLRRYPAVFEVYQERGNVLYVRFTEEAEAQYVEEMRLKEELEVVHIEKLRKLLMMSVDKSLTLDKIGHLKNDLGLPDDYKTNMLVKYPQYFKLVDTEAGAALELTAWDPMLAISAAQKKEAAEASNQDDRPRIIIDGEEIVPTQASNRRLNLPKGLNLPKKEREKALWFQQVKYVSPYSDAREIDPASVEAEKRACAVVHELLSLTLDKKTLVDHLTHFKDEYKFSQRIRATLLRHPEMFYISLKGLRDSVFLREAYQGSELVDKDPLVLTRERLRELVHTRPVHIIRSQKAGAEGGENVEEDEDKDDELYDESDDDEEGEREDDWSTDEEKQSGVGSVEEAEIPVRSSVSSPRKSVKSYTDLRPRTTERPIRGPRVATLERSRKT